MSAAEQRREFLAVASGVGVVIAAGVVGILYFDTDIGSGLNLSAPLDALGGLWASLTGLASMEALLFGGGALALIVATRQAIQSDEESTVWPLVALAGAVAAGYVLFTTGISGIADAVLSYWWVSLLALGGYAAYVFVAERSGPGDGRSATRSTSRRVQSAGEEIGDASVGLLVGIFGAASAVALALVQGLELFGDVLAQFAGEAAYLGTIVLGYLGYGGDFPGAWLIPDLSPVQFVAIALIIGGLAIAFRE